MPGGGWKPRPSGMLGLGCCRAAVVFSWEMLIGLCMPVCACVCCHGRLCAAWRYRSLGRNNLGEEAGKAIGDGMQHTPNLQGLG